MRQIGSLESESLAARFTAFLITQGIDAVAEADGNVWAVWIRDENAVGPARNALQEFVSNPKDPRYEGATEVAQQLREDEFRRREEARRRIVQMRGRWSAGGAGRRAPVMFVLIGICVLATIWTNFGKNQRNWGKLAFVDEAAEATADPRDSREVAAPRVEPDPLLNIRRGEIWRVITPIFVHLSTMHLVFNMYWAYALGSQIEDRKGSVRTLLLVVVTAIVSNLAQALIDSPYFGGFSGVGYGLFGYVWMKSTYDPSSGLRIDRSNTILFIAWFFLCLTGLVGPVANTAHGVGLFVGVVFGYAPVLWSRSSS